MTFWSNLIGYQLVWFAAVIGAGHGSALPGLAAALAFVIWQVKSANRPRAELRLIAVAVVLGLCLDGVLAASGWGRYAASAVSLPPGGAPLWILAIWASFAMTLNRSLAYLRTRPWIAGAFGAVGGPLAYASAARGWQVVTFEPPAWRGLLWLAFGWAVAMPLLATLARRWSRPFETAAPVLHGEPR